MEWKLWNRVQRHIKSGHIKYVAHGNAFGIIVDVNLKYLWDWWFNVWCRTGRTAKISKLFVNLVGN